MSEPVFYSCFPAAWIEVGGEDAFSFLQGQFSNDLRSDRPRPCVYGLFLDAKGKVEADAFVLRAEDGRFFLFSYYTPGATLVERLERYIIADDVEVTDRTPEVAGCALWGNGVAETLDASGLPVPAAREYAVGRGVWILAGRRSCTPAYDLLVPAERAEEETERIRKEARTQGGTEAGDERCHQERIRSRVPAVPLEIGPRSLPHEGGLDRDAVSYDKGCYTGQEVMARLRSKGKVRRRLVTVSYAEAVALPASLYRDGKEAGQLVFAVSGNGGYVGSALIHQSVSGNADALSLEPEGDPCVRIADRRDDRP